MASSGSIDLDKTLVHKVVKELVDFELRKGESSEKLLGSYSKPIIVQIQLGKEIKDSIIHPIRIQIPHSMYSPENEEHTVCIFCRTEDKESIDELLSNSPIVGVKSVISLSQVKKLYSSYKDKKELLSNHTHFVCDMRILNHLYNLLGKVFGKRNNYPLPMRLTKVIGLPSALSNVLTATYMYLTGKSISIRFGHTGMSTDDIIDNVISGLKSAFTKFPQNGKTIQSILCKLSDSPSLPLFSRTPDAMLEYVKQKAAVSNSEIMKNKTKGDDNVKIKKVSKAKTTTTIQKETPTPKIVPAPKKTLKTKK